LGGVDFRFLALNQTQVFTLRNHMYETSASRGVPVYVPAFLVLIASTHRGMARLS